MIYLLQDLDKWSIIIGDNHLDIQIAIKHLQSLEGSIAERMAILTERNDNPHTASDESEG